MKKRIPALCCALLLLAGCSVLEPVENASLPSTQESSSVESTLPDPAEDIDEPDATPESPPLPYEATAASITPALAGLAARHRQTYPDTVGWLRIPGTTIDNAVVQSDDATNEYYLQHDLDGNPSRDGTYSANTGCKLSGGREGISRNIALFAHNHDENPNGILFAQLKKYKDPDFARANPYLFFSTPEEDMVWEVFAVFDTVKQFNYIAADFGWARQRRVLEMAMDASIYDYGIVPDRNDRFLTLSTCSFDIPGVGMLPITTPNDYRFVVLARLVDPDEPKKDEAEIIPRGEFLLPDDVPLFDDAISLDGWSYYLREGVFDSPLVRPLNESALVLQGTVRRTIYTDSPRDWDATLLPVGTEIYADPSYPRLLVVDYDGERLYYAPDNTRLLLIRDNQVLAVRGLDYDVMRVLWPDDMPESPSLPDNDVQPSSSNALVIVVEYRNDLHTYYTPYYLATPPSVGAEVTVWQEYNAFFYRDAAIYRQLLAFFPEDSSQRQSPERPETE